MLGSDDDQVLVIRFWREDEAAESELSQHWRARITYNRQQFYAPGVDEAFAIVKFLLLAEKYQS